MGINVEFCPDLALRKHGTPARRDDECLPEKIYGNCVYDFLKKGQKNYWMEGEIPLRITDGEKLSRPVASVIILESTQFLHQKEVWTKGRYRIIEAYDLNDNTIHFDGLEKIV